MACLKKGHKMASDATALKISATQKLAEVFTTPISEKAFMDGMHGMLTARHAY